MEDWRHIEQSQAPVGNMVTTNVPETVIRCYRKSGDISRPSEGRCARNVLNQHRVVESGKTKWHPTKAALSADVVVPEARSKARFLL
jgi:hypothetical protein